MFADATHQGHQNVEWFDTMRATKPEFNTNEEVGEVVEHGSDVKDVFRPIRTDLRQATSALETARTATRRALASTQAFQIAVAEAQAISALMAVTQTTRRALKSTLAAHIAVTTMTTQRWTSAQLPRPRPDQEQKSEPEPEPEEGTSDRSRSRSRSRTRSRNRPTAPVE